MPLDTLKPRPDTTGWSPAQPAITLTRPYESLLRPGRRARPGHATQISHWGELIQGPVWHRGAIHTGLITLPRKDRFAAATFTPAPYGATTVSPSEKKKALRAARMVLRRAEQHDLGGWLNLRSNILKNGGGGSSTADIIAAIRATSAAIGSYLTDEEVQRICFEVEGASDPLALIEDGDVVIYGSRCGEIIARIPGQLPPMVCLGFVTAPDVTVLTESLVGREGYTDDEARCFIRIIDKAKRGVALRRADLVAQAATESARLNQFRVETRHFDELVRIGGMAGARGISVSHSGVVAAAIFEPNSNSLTSRLESMASALSALGCTEIQPFTVNIC